MIRIVITAFFSLFILACQAQPSHIPPGFVEVKDFIPSIVVEPRYHSVNNFMGRTVEGYEADKIYITEEAAVALKKVQQELKQRKLGLKIFDAYRPQMAVDDFVQWANDLDDTLRKAEYYPEIPKNQLFEKGYIAEHSGHSRGSTVDVTLVDLSTGKELDMGTGFDYFSPKSWPHSNEVTQQQKQNRILLRGIMMKHGFEPLATEWWHFSLADEPFPDQYFNFEVR